ncbi:MAG: NYN domain-containing protein [Acidimicrobiia bacterium]|jgi:predicted RNA-binding protein with PIN domain
MIEELPVELLTPALKAGRAALRRLDEDEVPAKLRKVSAYQGGRLPAPLVRSLLTFLDDEAWLREKAQDELGSYEPDSTGPRRASGLFLHRPPGWEFELGRSVGGSLQAAAERRVGELDSLVGDVEAREAETKRRLTEVQAQLDEAHASSDEEVESVRIQLRQVREGDRRELEILENKIAGLEAEKLSDEDALAELGQMVDSLKERLHRAEVQRASTEQRFQSGAGQAWAAGDPVDLARHLDMLIRTVEADPELLAYLEPVADREFRLPPGARPDERNAVEWLLRQPQPFTMVVDGYNVAFQLVGESTRAARDRVNEELSRLRLRTMTPTQVTVVYDSSVNSEVETAPGPGGIRVRFTREGHIADEEIAEIVSTLDGPVVVVSSDREVREGTAELGAVVLWSEALVEWIKAR